MRILVRQFRWSVARSLRTLAFLSLATMPRLLQAQAGVPDAGAAVRAAMSGFMDALNALDVPRMNDCFTEDITAFVPVAQADVVEGREAVTAIFQRFVDLVRPSTPRLQLVPEKQRVEVSGTLAVVTFEIRETAPRITRRRTFVFRKERGRWLISHFHASDLSPVSR